MKAVAFALSLLFVSATSFAGHKGLVTFDEDEQAEHVATLETVLSTTQSCLRADLKYHSEFYKKWGISPFYGDRSSFSKLSYAQKKAFLKKLGKPEKLVDLLQPTSCIGLTVKCMEKGFKAAGQEAIWAKLKSMTAANDYDGTSLQTALRNLGWTVLYWNPNPSKNKAWDAAEKAKDPENKLYFWGYHESRYNSVMKKGTYYWNYVDDDSSLVNFGTNVPQGFKDIPFFVGTAHTGYHVFPGIYGQVIEGHSTRSITDPQTLESSPFNPIANGGGPRGEYKSGLIAIPPGY
jgi:hypothetical protein